MAADQAWNKKISYNLGWLLIKCKMTRDDCWFSLPSELSKASG